MSDSEHLQQFLATGCESHFEAIVQKYGGLVLGTAMRQTQDRTLAEDITQQVFATFAQKIATIREPHKLGAWLHRTTLWHVANSVRKAATHRQQLKRYRQNLDVHHSMNEHNDDDHWQDVLPKLDSAMDALKPVERDLLILRYFEQRSYKSIAHALRKSEDACRKQTGRVIDKLCRQLQKSGVVIPSAVLAAGLANHLGGGISSTLASTISQSALATTTSATAFTTTTSLFLMSKTATISLATLAFLAPIGVQWASNKEAKEQAPSSLLTASPPVSSESGESGSGDNVATPAANNVGRSETELANVMRQLASHPNPDHARADLAQFILTLSYAELPLALKNLPSLRDANHRRAVAGALAARWVEFDPEEAIVEAVKHKDRHHLFGSEWGAIAAWVVRDRDAALAWIDQIDDETKRKRLMNAYWYGLAEIDPVAAANSAKELEDENARADRLNDIVRKWRERDPKAAIHWLDHFEDGAQRDQWLDGLVNQLSFSNPEEALDYAMQLFTGYHQQRVVTNVLASLAFTEPEKAVEKMLGLAPEMQSSEMASKLGTEMRDIAVVETVLPKLADHDKLPDFVAGLAQGVGYERFASQPSAIPTLAMLAEGLTDNDARELAGLNIARGWMRADAEAAREWIAETELLSEERKNRYLQATSEKEQ